MAVAERVSWMYGFDELAVISGVGVRGYYEKLGYHMDEDCEGEFMVKSLPHESEKVKWAKRERKGRKRKVGAKEGEQKRKEEEEEEVGGGEGQFLPMVLFGNVFTNEEIQTPLSHLTLAALRLPNPTLLVGEEKGEGEKMDPAPREYVNKESFVVRSYQGIQGGRPQLVVVKGDKQRGPVAGPISKFANTFVAAREDKEGGEWRGVVLALLVILFGVLVGLVFGGEFL